MNAPIDTARVLAEWEAEEAERRARMSTSGVASPAQVAGLSGMEVFDGIFSGRLPPPPIGETLDFLPIEIEFQRFMIVLSMLVLSTAIAVSICPMCIGSPTR